ncbi:hypothetical protein H920_05654 [Fukomys damarensis]|uniref:Uncharacterized protein n=1 Tax=Fukomys damarensis TaxID=885580 RepID=A0A091DRD3_FUKDA|nr:hypothetical protein H920_05654 [Fukomys damarensis]
MLQPSKDEGPLGQKDALYVDQCEAESLRRQHTSSGLYPHHDFYRRRAYTKGQENNNQSYHQGQRQDLSNQCDEDGLKDPWPFCSRRHIPSFDQDRSQVRGTVMAPSWKLGLQRECPLQERDTSDPWTSVGSRQLNGLCGYRGNGDVSRASPEALQLLRDSLCSFRTGDSCPDCTAPAPHSPSPPIIPPLTLIVQSQCCPSGCRSTYSEPKSHVPTSASAEDRLREACVTGKGRVPSQALAGHGAPCLFLERPLGP